MRTGGSICQVRILYTHKKETDWSRLTGEKIYGMVKIVDRRRIYGEKGQPKETLARISRLCWTLKVCKYARNTISLRPKAGCNSSGVAIIRITTHQVWILK